MHEPASYISLLFVGKTDLASTNIKPIKMNYIIEGQQNAITCKNIFEE